MDPDLLDLADLFAEFAAPVLAHPIPPTVHIPIHVPVGMQNETNQNLCEFYRQTRTLINNALLTVTPVLNDLPEWTVADVKAAKGIIESIRNNAKCVEFLLHEAEEHGVIPIQIPGPYLDRLTFLNVVWPVAANAGGLQHQEEAAGGLQHQEEAAGGLQHQEEAAGGLHHQEEGAGGLQHQEEGAGGLQHQEEGAGGGIDEGAQEDQHLDEGLAHGYFDDGAEENILDLADDAAVPRPAASAKALRKPVFTTIDQLLPYTHGHNLTAHVISSRIVFDKFSNTGRTRVAECLVGDRTGTIIFTARNQQVDHLKPGTTVIFRNAKIDMFKGTMRLAVDRWGRIELTHGYFDDGAEENILDHADDAAVPRPAASAKALRKPVFTTIDQLLPDTHGHNLTAHVISSRIVFDKFSNTGRTRVAECLVGDRTGTIIFTARNQQVDHLKPGTTVIFRNAKIDMFKDTMRLAVDEWGRIELTEAADFKVKQDNNLSLVEYELVDVDEGMK